MLEIVIILASLIKAPVSRCTKNRWQGFHTFWKFDVVEFLFHAFAAKVGSTTAVIMNAQACLHGADNDCRTSCRTYTCRSIKPVELDTSFGQRVDVRCLDNLVTITTEPTAHILELNPEKVLMFTGMGLKLKP